MGSPEVRLLKKEVDGEERKSDVYFEKSLKVFIKVCKEKGKIVLFTSYIF